MIVKPSQSIGAPNLLSVLKDDAQERLLDAGSLQGNSGSFENGRFTLSFESNTGDKLANEDAAFLWTAKDCRRVGWVAAIADGVSGSIMGGTAAEFACLVAMASVVTGAERGRVTCPIFAAEDAFRIVGKQIAKPEGMPAFFWKRAQRDGRFLQTTLTVIWSIQSEIRIASLGDGGFLYRRLESPQCQYKNRSQFFAALGPKSKKLSVYRAKLAPEIGQFACFTDGLTPVVDAQPKAIATLFQHSADAASATIRYAMNKCPELVADNITVFQFTRGGLKQ